MSSIASQTSVLHAPAIVQNGETSPNSTNKGKAPETARNGPPAPPQINVNGVASSPSPRISKSPTVSSSEGEAKWGSHFWVTLIDPESQTSFFACPATGQVSWDPPVGNFVLPPNADGEWWELSDESRGGIAYYYHTKSGETVWERPDGFVIPLSILQNTALGRRLSINMSNRMSQLIPEPAPASTAASAAASSDSTISPSNNRRSRSYTNSKDPVQAPQRSPIPNERSKDKDRQVRRSLSSDRPGINRHASVGTQLAPIPGSPYATDVDAASTPPPSPNGHTHLSKGKARESVGQRAVSPPPGPSALRSRSKSSSYVPRVKEQPQSLHAAAEMFAQAQQQQLSRPPELLRNSVRTEYRAKSDIGHSMDDTERRAEAPPSPTTPTTPLRVEFRPKVRIDGDEASLLMRDKGKERNGIGGAGMSSTNVATAPPSPRRPIPPVPRAGGPLVPRRGASAPGFVGKDIGNPVFNAEATLNMSPVKARNTGKPILIEPQSQNQSRSDLSKSSTGLYPTMPQDLASEIQQFVKSDYAKQYFSTHRTGFIFKRRVPVEQMMTWQKAPLTSPLLLLNRPLHKNAVKIFKVIQRIMGDRERDRPVGVRMYSDGSHISTIPTAHNGSTTSLHSFGHGHVTIGGVLEEERWLLNEGIMHGELRDEIFCQLMKQLSGNPGPESVFRGWQLLCVLLITFPPSKNFEAYLRSFMQQRTTHTEGRVDVMAKHCIQRLAVIAKKGPRGKAPTLPEIETASDAAFNPSTFGESLDAVFRLQERNYPGLHVPIILPFLSDGILALGGTKSEGIFRVPGDGDSVSELKLRIDKGFYNLDDIDDPHILASLFKLWLRELRDPLVPEELYNDCVGCANDPQACVQIIERLPTNNRRVVLFVVSFLQLFLDEKIQTITKMTSANLALVMAPNLLRCNSESMTVVFTNAQYEQAFVHNLLLHLKCNKLDPDFVPTHGLGPPISPLSPRTSKSRSRRPNDVYC